MYLPIRHIFVCPVFPSECSGISSLNLESGTCINVRALLGVFSLHHDQMQIHSNKSHLTTLKIIPISELFHWGSAKMTIPHHAGLGVLRSKTYQGKAVAWWLMPRTPDPEVGGSSPTRVKPCCVLEQGTFTPQKYW